LQKEGTFRFRSALMISVRVTSCGGGAAIAPAEIAARSSQRL
jgi:hypothetical protein